MRKLINKTQVTRGFQWEIVQYIQMQLSSQANEKNVYIAEAWSASNSILLYTKILEGTVSVESWG